MQGGVDGPSGNDEHNDDDQFDLGMCYDEYQQESLDRHWAVMVKTFRSLDEVYTFYNKHARERGFSIRKDSLKRSKDRARTVRLRRYLCSAAGNDRPSSVPWKAGPAGLDRRVDSYAKPI